LSADEDRLAVRDGDGHPERARCALDVTKRKFMRSKPSCESILIAAELDPVDADGGTTVIDEYPARVVHVVDQPLNGEGETLFNAASQGDEAPFELLPSGTMRLAVPWPG
jgi:hypothetical protein